MMSHAGDPDLFAIIVALHKKVIQSPSPPPPLRLGFLSHTFFR
jgi:hypothetical protein